jgi:hypothetical protein
MHAGYLPGYPGHMVAFGCQQMATCFQNATIGTQVAIHQESPYDYASNPLQVRALAPGLDYGAISDYFQISVR